MTSIVVAASDLEIIANEARHHRDERDGERLRACYECPRNKSAVRGAALFCFMRVSDRGEYRLLLLMLEAVITDLVSPSA